MSESGQGKPGRFAPNVEHLRKLLVAADHRPLPWHATPSRAADPDSGWIEDADGVGVCLPCGDAVGALIVAAVNTLGMCLDEIERLEREIADIRSQKAEPVTEEERARIYEESVRAFTRIHE